MKSSFLSLNNRDFLKALAVAVLSPVITIIVQTTGEGQLTFDWKAMLTTAISAAGAYLLKNLFTDDVKSAQATLRAASKKNGDQPLAKGFVVLVILSFSFLCGNAQNFFKPIPPKNKGIVSKKVARVVAAPPSSFWAIRPIASAVTLFIDGATEAAAGVGISYQNISQDETGRNYVNYSFNALALAGGSVVPNNPSTVGKFALMISALNGTVSAGYGFSNRIDPVTQKKKWKGGLALAWTVNFNN